MKYKLLSKPSITGLGFAWNSEKVKNILAAFLVVVAVSGTFFYLFNKDNYQESVMGSFLGSLFSDSEETEEEPAQEVEYAQGNDYLEKAQEGDGLTHVARRVLEKHFQKQGITKYTAEHKVFMEDYIQKELGGETLVLGQEVSVSQEMISQAIQQADLLSQEQLDNLRQYSSLVSFS
jgi:hypothetical protein